MAKSGRRVVKLGRRVAKLGRRVAKWGKMGCYIGEMGGYWLSWYRACLLRQLSWFESRHLSKTEDERHKKRSGQHTLARQKNIQKKILSLFAAADGESPLGTQLAISRKKKPKRRSTGVVNIDLDVRFYKAYFLLIKELLFFSFALTSVRRRIQTLRVCLIV